MARVRKSPDAFRTISEVARWLETPAHVLRFWESRFDQIAPVKRAGGRRYYRPEDMQLLGGIKHLLHDEGRTIKSVQELMEAEGTDAVLAFSQALPSTDTEAQTPAVEPETKESSADHAETAKAPEPVAPEPEDLNVAPVIEAAPDLSEPDQSDDEDVAETAPADDSEVEDPAVIPDAPAFKRRKPRHGFMVGYPAPDDAQDTSAALSPEQSPEATLPPLPDLPPDPEDNAALGVEVISTAAVLRGLNGSSATLARHAAVLSDAARRLEAVGDGRP